MYDQFGHAAFEEGGGTGAGGYGQQAGSGFAGGSFHFGGGPGGYQEFHYTGEDLDDIFDGIFGQGKGYGGFHFGGADQEENIFGGRGRARRSREGEDVLAKVDVTFEEAALGADKVISFRSPDGSQQSLKVHIPAGIDSGQKIRLRGKGVPSLRNKNVRGDQYVTLVVQVPTKLSEEAKDALRAFDAACQGKPAPEKEKKKRFMDKLKEKYSNRQKGLSGKQKCFPDNLFCCFFEQNLV